MHSPAPASDCRSRPWTQAGLTVAAADADALCEALLSGGALGAWLQEHAENTTVVAYYRNDCAARAGLSRAAALLPGLDPFPQATLDPLTDECWEETWKAQFSPLVIGDRWAVVAPWHQPPAGRSAITIEPGRAFGTGLHHTTRLCLEALAEAELAGATVLDIGTGSGVLAIAASEAGAGRVVAVDCDPVAVWSAAGNLKRNGVADRVALLVGAGVAGLRLTADLVVANLTSTAVCDLAEALPGVLKSGGVYVASGIALERAAVVESRLCTLGFEITRRRQAGEWAAYETVLRS